MTGRSSAKRTGLCLLALLLSCLSSDKLYVVGEPEPIPSEFFYNKNFINNPEDLLLLNKLKEVVEEKEDMIEREKALDEMRMVIQSELEARTKEARVQSGDYSVEELPTPNAMVGEIQRSGKRTAISYMTLCHFKICNMGLKRQLHKM